MYTNNHMDDVDAERIMTDKLQNQVNGTKWSSTPCALPSAVCHSRLKATTVNISSKKYSTEKATDWSWKIQ